MNSCTGLVMLLFKFNSGLLVFHVDEIRQEWDFGMFGLYDYCYFTFRIRLAAFQFYLWVIQKDYATKFRSMYGIPVDQPNYIYPSIL